MRYKDKSLGKLSESSTVKQYADCYAATSIKQSSERKGAYTDNSKTQVQVLSKTRENSSERGSRHSGPGSRCNDSVDNHENEKKFIHNYPATSDTSESQEAVDGQELLLQSDSNTEIGRCGLTNPRSNTLKFSPGPINLTEKKGEG